MEQKTDKGSLTYIEATEPGGRRRYVGIEPAAGTASQWVGVARAVIVAVEKFMQRAADLRLAAVGPVERGERLREQVGATLKALQDAAQKIVDGRDSLVARMATATAVKAYENDAAHKALVDLEIARIWRGDWPAGRRAGLIAAARAAAVDALAPGDLDVCDALLRMPLAVTGLANADREALRVGLVRALRPDLYDGLDGEREGIVYAARAVVESTQTIIDLIGSADVRERAATALQLTAGWQPVVWLADES